MYERTEMLIGIDNLNIFKNQKILIVGIGGVGGTALEVLVRSGFENITITDFDTISESNLNRQIISNINNIGLYKVDEAEKRCKGINKNVNISKIYDKLSSANINILGYYDYIIDACDSIDAKIALIKYAKNNNINIIVSCGMGNRLDVSKIYMTKLSKTENDPLAKKLRSELRKENINLNIPVVASKELPIKSKKISSMMSVPFTAGIYIANYVINDIILKKK